MERTREQRESFKKIIATKKYYNQKEKSEISGTRNEERGSSELNTHSTDYTHENRKRYRLTYFTVNG